MIKGCNIFCGKKLAKTCSFVDGRIVVQQKKVSRAERSWTDPKDVRQQAIQYCFIKFWIYCFFPPVRILCALRLESRTNSQCGTFGILVSSAEGMTHLLIQMSLCFGVTSKTTGLISHNNFASNIFVCIGHRDNVLARRDSIFPLLRCQAVWNKTCTQLSLSQIIFQNPKNYSLGDVQTFCYHS